MNDPKPEAVDFCNEKQKNRFDDVNDEYFDELASEIHKKRTKKQIAWAVKIFRSKQNYF